MFFTVGPRFLCTFASRDCGIVQYPRWSIWCSVIITNLNSVVLKHDRTWQNITRDKGSAKAPTFRWTRTNENQRERVGNGEVGNCLDVARDSFRCPGPITENIGSVLPGMPFGTIGHLYICRADNKAPPKLQAAFPETQAIGTKWSQARKLLEC